ncbi:glycoprotein 3-alpha-L-fucosyltransferase A-like [Macrosteles quadrilineatus]|uniref:glycoprotein 3-alpha-L-fucosyltransferase A-like n=1 Tax=Macrosteles quadrilineatus TaxID=74068 RepID=UPI0023E3085A|nr:glycoprotein 3-alpha-L-fucosyltransferase A-like [Macrosteles quadrilineatus]XP_054271111.1 glycoprotein 3-alpha-L-fucosyltransferase A-like [Macrosteles quadrilineatus]XP_054271112.1 glycoprotein 3-alpha-L-fucosyltransferase A-like [Macrosteles quadrilineatus]
MFPRYSRTCFVILVSVVVIFFTVVMLLSFHEDLGERKKRTGTQDFKLGSWSWVFQKPIQDVEENTSVIYNISKESLPWYFKGGLRMPQPSVRGLSGHQEARLWPAEDPDSDRIENQLMFVPPDPIPAGKLKKILLMYGLYSWDAKPGTKVFAKCPVKSCSLTINRQDASNADAILFKDYITHPGVKRPSSQVWILFHLESPPHTSRVDDQYNSLVNWTATYRRDSDIVTPYDKWVYWDPQVTQYPGPLRDFAANKTGKVAWFVSNCGARNGRLQYAHELQKYIQVDIYGACGNLVCPRSISEKCFDLLDKKYKFYLAFENSNCKDYITEKFFVNGLKHKVLPIVMGARPEDYAKVAPKNSYIHVDDFESPKHLAKFLHKLDQDDDLYNSYFRWKDTGEYIDSGFFCRICSLLHADFPDKNYHEDMNKWWHADGICTPNSWRDVNG